MGNAVWIFSTSALLVALPLALVLEDEAKIVQQEREIIAQQQGQQVRFLTRHSTGWLFFRHATAITSLSRHKRAGSFEYSHYTLFQMLAAGTPFGAPPQGQSALVPPGF